MLVPVNCTSSKLAIYRNDKMSNNYQAMPLIWTFVHRPQRASIAEISRPEDGTANESAKLTARDRVQVGRLMLPVGSPQTQHSYILVVSRKPETEVSKKPIEPFLAKLYGIPAAKLHSIVPASMS